MKKLTYTLICIVFTIISMSAFGQEDTIIQINKNEIKSSNIYYQADTMPILHCDCDGNYLEKINQFIRDNLQWPDNEIDCSGKVYVQFIVETNGSISDIKIIRGLDSCTGFNEEALRVVKLMKSWTPGLKDNQKVRVMLTVAVKFMLE
jgi:TonB family protein